MAKRPEPTGPKPPLPGLLKFVTRYQTTTLTDVYHGANVLHVKIADPTQLTLTNLQNFMGTYTTDFDTRFKPFRNPTWKIVGWDGIALDGSGISWTVTGNNPGTGANLPSAPSLAVCVSWRSNIYWRGGKPRTYLPGVPGSAFSTAGDALLLSTYTNGLATAAIGFISDVANLAFGTTTAALGFPSYYSKYAFRNPPVFYPFTNAVVHDRIDSQRRRSGKESLYPVD